MGPGPGYWDGWPKTGIFGGGLLCGDGLCIWSCPWGWEEPTIGPGGPPAWRCSPGSDIWGLGPFWGPTWRLVFLTGIPKGDGWLENDCIEPEGRKPFGIDKPPDSIGWFTEECSSTLKLFMLSTKFASGGGDRIEGGPRGTWDSKLWGELTLELEGLELELAKSALGELELEPTKSARFKNIGLIDGTGGGGFLLGGGTRDGIKFQSIKSWFELTRRWKLNAIFQVFVQRTANVGRW